MYKKIFVILAAIIMVGTLFLGAGEARKVIGASSDQSALDTATTGGATSGAVSEDMAIDTALNDAAEFGTAITDTKLAALQDTEINIEITDVDGNSVEDTYDIHESIVFADSLAFETALTISSFSEKLKDEFYLMGGDDSISYLYTFDDALVNGNYLANATSDDPIELKFLGQDMLITGAPAATQLTVTSGDAHYLAKDGTVTVGSDTVKFVRAGSTDTAVIEYKGTVYFIDEGDSKRMGSVDVYVKNVLDDTSSNDDDAAYIYTSTTDARKTYTSGEAFYLPCSATATEKCSKNAPDWVWSITDTDSTNPVIGVILHRDFNSMDDAFLPITVGGKVVFPNNFATVTFDKTTATTWGDFTFTVTTKNLYADCDNIGTATYDSAYVVKIEGPDGSSILNGTDTSQESRYAYIHFDNDTNYTQTYWESDDCPTYPILGSNITDSADDVLKFVYEDTTVDVNIDDYAIVAAGVTFNINIEGTNQEIDLLIDTTASASNEIEYLGSVDGDATAGDLTAGGKEISTAKYNTMTQDAIRIYTPEDNGDSDEFAIALPADSSDFEGTFSVMLGAGGVAVADSADSFSATLADGDLIAGDCAVPGSIITADDLGLTSCTPADLEAYYGGKEKWKIVGLTKSGKNVYMVAGYEATQTKAAMDWIIANGLPTWAAGVIKSG